MTGHGKQNVFLKFIGISSLIIGLISGVCRGDLISSDGCPQYWYNVSTGTEGCDKMPIGDTNAHVDWGEQGPNILVIACKVCGHPYVMAASGVITYDTDTISWTDDCGWEWTDLGGPVEPPNYYVKAGKSNTILATGQCDCSCYYSGGSVLTADLKVPPCIGAKRRPASGSVSFKLLERAEWGTDSHYWENCDEQCLENIGSPPYDENACSECCDDCGSAVVQVKAIGGTSVGVKHIGNTCQSNPPIPGICGPNAGSDGYSGCSGSSGGGRSGCSSCGSANKGGTLQIGNLSYNLSTLQKETLANYGSIYQTNTPEINEGGFWYRVQERPGWGADDVILQGDGNTAAYTCTKAYFNVWDDMGMTHYYEKTGTWTGTESEAKAAARVACKGRIPLRYVYKGGGTTKQYFSYHATSDNVLTQYDGSGHYIIYDYDDASSETAKLKRVWAGTNTTQYVPRDSGDCAGGRWIDTWYDENGMLTHVEHGCESCGVGNRNYEYTPSQLYTSEYYSKQLLSKIEDASTPTPKVLEAYQFDSQDRVTAYWLGDVSTGLKVKVGYYSDYDFEDPDNSYNALTQRDYVTSTQYRAKVYLYNAGGDLTAEYHYHDVQTGDTLSGGYSLTRYEYQDDGSGNLTHVVITKPNMNKSHEYYSSGQITMKTQSDYDESNAITTQRSSYTTVYSGFDYQVPTQVIDARGGTSEFCYTSGSLTRQIGPDPDSPLSNPGRLTTNYLYDSDDQVTLSYRSGPNGDVSTVYTYDNYGNLITQIEAYGSADAATTVYAYNEYNQVTMVTDPREKIRKTFYSSSGAVTAEAVYDDSGSNVISETQYVFDDNGWLATKKVANDTTAFTLHSPDSWILETYLYDDYGRKTAVIADTGGKNLTTQYEYNNQSEITKVTQPDERFQITERDGRGLVKYEITGDGTHSATTSFWYDLNGNLIKKTDPEGVTEIYQYDEFDRMTRSRRGG